MQAGYVALACGLAHCCNCFHSQLRRVVAAAMRDTIATRI
jgi:hypothetical protein